MPWLSNWFHKLTHGPVDVNLLKQKLQDKSATNEDLLCYVDELEDRKNEMVKQLKELYKKYNLNFTGFTSLDLACEYLRDSIKHDNDVVYNNLTRLESLVTTEGQRHLALVSMIVMQNGKRVIELIYNDANNRAIFESIFLSKVDDHKNIADGVFNDLWQEMHKLSEYILLQRNKVYH